MLVIATYVKRMDNGAALLCKGHLTKEINAFIIVSINTIAFFAATHDVTAVELRTLL